MEINNMYLLEKQCLTETIICIDSNILSTKSYEWTVRISSVSLQDDSVIDLEQLDRVINDSIGTFHNAIVVDKQFVDDGVVLSDIDESMSDIIVLSNKPTLARISCYVYSLISPELPESVELVSVKCKDADNSVTYCPTVIW